MKPLLSLILSIGALLATQGISAAVAPPPAPVVPADLKEFRTPALAITTRISRAVPAPTPGQPGYLGVAVESRTGKLIVMGVDANSPAAQAGVRIGDLLAKAAGNAVADPAMLAETVRARSAGDPLPLVLYRDGKQVEADVTLAAVSRPLTPGRRGVLGVQMEFVPEGARVRSILPGSAADKAKLKTGDVVVAIDGEKLAGRSTMANLSGKRPGEQVRLTIRRGDSKFDVRTTLDADPTAGPGGRGWDDRQPLRFRKPVYRLAVIGIEYPDVKHNPKIKTTDWERALFSTKTYTDHSPTGQKVHGSMNDYYQEISCAALKVQGKAFDWVTVSRKRLDYSNDSSKVSLLREVMDKLLARDKSALDGYDGVFFLYAGERAPARRGSLYWPHRATLSHKGKRWPYFICPEGGRTMASISVLTHEFGHMLGLPDLYARPEVPGEEGLGVWCTMSVGHGKDGKPLHFSAWCKEQMGWLHPAVIDPRTKQKLILAPVEGTTKECLKVLIRSDGSEYLLLENRRKIGFDHNLPAEGLLIWRVVNGRPVLEESHGIAGPAGPILFLGSIPYPSPSNTAFTPFTTPSSKSIKGGGLPVYITNIRKLPDGRITFHIGYEYL